MTKRTKTIVLSAVIICVCVAVAVAAVLLVLLRADGMSHLRTDGVKLTLVRDGLEIDGLNSEGKYAHTVNEEKTDFTSSTQQNVFGIQSNTIIVPGNSFTASMTVSGKSAFAYWLEIKLGGELNELSKKLKITVTVEDGTRCSFYLGESLTAGSDQDPLARVTDGSSSFTVKVEFERDNKGNGDEQDKWVGFDLVVHAANID